MTYNKLTENTITDPLILSKELKEIKKNGYAIDNEENEEGIYCVAAPILNSRHIPLAAVSITVPPRG